MFPYKKISYICLSRSLASVPVGLTVPLTPLCSHVGKGKLLQHVLLLINQRRTTGPEEGQGHLAW